MKIYIVLLRGINVGGKNVLPMTALSALLERLGCRDVRTYIQSGNAVFRSKGTDGRELSIKIGAAIRTSHGFEPVVQLLEVDELESIVTSNPFPEAESEPKTLYVNILESAPRNPDLKTMESIKTGSERFAVKGRVFYLHAPGGIGRSKLAANAEKLLGVSMTGRNWRTIGKILGMAKAYP